MSDDEEREDEGSESVGVSDVSELEWLSGEQLAALDELGSLRGEWRSWLPAELDAAWPEWVASTPEVLGPWLDEWLPSLTSDDDATAEQYDMRSLYWIAPHQQQQLEQLPSLGGEWRSWLPVELDAAWPEWVDSAPEVLGPWLDEWLTSLTSEVTEPEDQSPSGAAGDPDDIGTPLADDGFEEGDLTNLFQEPSEAEPQLEAAIAALRSENPQLGALDDATLDAFVERIFAKS